MGRFRRKEFFLSHYSESVLPGNTYPHPKKTLVLEDPLCWMAFPRWQPGLRNEQVKFTLGLKWPTITLTSMQTRFEHQGKFMNFYEIYEYFRKIFFWVIYWFFISKLFFLWIFMKFIWVFSGDFSFFESYRLFIPYSMAQRTSTEVSRILRPRTERVNYLEYLDCLTVMNFLFRKSANWYLKLKRFFCSHRVPDFFRENTLLEKFQYLNLFRRYEFF